MKEINSSGSGSGRGRRTMKLDYMKVAKFRRKGKLSREKEEQSAVQTEGPFKEVSNSEYVKPEIPSLLFSIIIDIMGKFNTCEASKEEKGWSSFSLHSEMECESQSDQNSGGGGFFMSGGIIAISIVWEDTWEIVSINPLQKQRGSLKEVI